MSIIDDINLSNTKAELKNVYQSSIKPIKILQKAVEDIESSHLEVSIELANAKDDLRSALIDGLTADVDESSFQQIIDALRARLGNITESDLEL